VIAWLASAARARLALADGDAGAAKSVLSRLRYRRINADGGAAGTAMLDEFLAPLEADIALRDGDVSRARLVLAEAAQNREPGSGLLLAQARLLLAQGDSQGAMAAIAPFLADSAAGTTLQDKVCGQVTAAIAARRLGNAEQAGAWLTFALALAEPHGMYRPFLDSGAAARSALTVLIRPASQGAAFAARILQRFEVSPGPSGGQPASPAVPLTSSELAVLRFLPSHMTNQEIAEALFLSINTVKTHLRSVYRKLGVTTRRQAITRGGKLGLL